jgi:hypothetical protein
MCRVLGVSKSGFYAWSERPLSKRGREDIALSAKIHRWSRGVYGAPNVHAELADAHGINVGCKRVARLMRAAGLKGVMPKRFVTTTVCDDAAATMVDLVDRQFKADGADQRWVADITYIPTWSGFLYLAIVLDVWSPKIVGWAMATHLRTELVLEALNRALMQRRPLQVVHHSDRGCLGDFQRSSQHLDFGGVGWDDQEVGLQRDRGERRCIRQAAQVLISVTPSKRFGLVLQQGHPVRKLHWRAACRSRSVPAGSGRLEGYGPSAWLRTQAATCRLPSARNLHY